MNEVVAIGISLLAIVVWTWVSLSRINRKLDRLLQFFAQSYKGEEKPNHADSVETDK